MAFEWFWEQVGMRGCAALTHCVPQLAAGNPGLYLNTQDGTDQLHHLLASDWPATPQLLKTAKCEIQQTNLWLGGARGSSRLHHDYADNMWVRVARLGAQPACRYVLLRGQKHIKLYSPADAVNMYTQGSIKDIAPNGVCTHLAAACNKENSCCCDR